MHSEIVRVRTDSDCIIFSIQQLCRNGSVSSPLLCLNDKIAGSSYKEPFPHTVRALSTSSANRDIDSAAKLIGAGMATIGVGGSGKLHCEPAPKKPMRNKNEKNSRFSSNFDFSFTFLVFRYRHWCCLWQFDDELRPKSILEKPTVFICGAGIRAGRSHGTILFDGRVFVVVWNVM